MRAKQAVCGTRAKYVIGCRCEDCRASALAYEHRRRDPAYIPKKRHNLSNTPSYRSWRAMLARCNDPSHNGYWRYGGRGIRVHARYTVFQNLVDDIGVRPSGTSLDRLNSDGNYEPGNVRWATKSEQRLNQSPSGYAKKGPRSPVTGWSASWILWTHLYAGVSLAEIAEAVGCSRTTIQRRLGLRK